MGQSWPFSESPPGRYAVAVAKKKRKPGKQGKGLSGNPQRRAEQIRARDEAGPASEATRPAGTGASGVGRHRTWPWWAASHEAVLARVRDTEWPDRLLDIETLAGRLAGDEFHARLSAPGSGAGMNPAGWFRTLTETALDALSDDLAEDGKNWQRLWAFACGLADGDGADEVAAAASGFATLGVAPVPAVPVPWYQPAEGGDVLVARDAYGDRFLFAAPFGDPGQPDAVDHWYAWDVDWCGNDRVVAGGAHDSADGALSEWRDAVGLAAASAEFSPCPLELGIRLLGRAQPESGQAESVAGDEPVELFREWPRLSRRASTLSASLSRRFRADRSSALADERDAAIDEFLDQHTGHAWNTPGDRDAAEHALDLILEFWGPILPADERAFFACSPHRIETCAGILRDSYEPDAVNEALRLLPDWVQWCARHIGLGEEFTERAVAAARAEAATPAGEYQAVRRREAPFRRPE
jgi:hypothetical protein